MESRRERIVRRTAACAALALAALLGPAPAGAEIYSWVDGDGKLHFSSDLSKVPAGQRGRAEAEALRREAEDPVQRHHTHEVAPPARRAPARTLAGQRTYTIKVPPGSTTMRVRVRLNDQLDAPFVIDTGASDVVIPRAVADQLGIRPGPDQLTMQYRTANGLVESPVVTLRSVSLGGARVEDVPASISDNLPVGLLGLSYFNHFQYEIDTARGLVHLTPNDMAETGAMRGGRTQGQWRTSFLNLRSRIEAVQEEIERTPDSRSRKHDRLETQREGLMRQLSRLEAEADQARVPFAWRE
jgi:clan AA aspartic protease (TIGR02281 family)